MLIYTTFKVSFYIRQLCSIFTKKTRCPASTNLTFSLLLSFLTSQALKSKADIRTIAKTKAVNFFIYAPHPHPQLFELFNNITRSKKNISSVSWQMLQLEFLIMQTKSKKKNKIELSMLKPVLHLSMTGAIGSGLQLPDVLIFSAVAFASLFS